MHTSHSTFTLFAFRNPCYEPSPLPSSSLLFRVASSSSGSSPMVYREGHSLLVLTKSSDPVFVPAQREKQHRQKALIYYWRVNKPISACFLYDLAAVLKKQAPTISFRSSASLINTMILLLTKLFEEGKPCASTFALMDLTTCSCIYRDTERANELWLSPHFWTNNTLSSLLM